MQDVLLQVRVPDQEMRRILSAAEEQEMGMIALDFQILLEYSHMSLLSHSGLFIL